MPRTSAALVLAGLLALTIWTPAAAHPGHGGETITVDGDGFAYAPATLSVGVNDTVIWFWDGTLFRNHSVTADPGQEEQFDSDPGGLPTSGTHPNGSSFTHTFTHEGTFTYHCKVHPQMRGTVDVVAIPVKGKPPRLSSLRVTHAVARFRLSQRADVVARIVRLGAGRDRVVESFSKRARAGANRLRLPTKSLDPGRYELRLVAYGADDRRSNEARDRFAVRDR